MKIGHASAVFAIRLVQLVKILALLEALVEPSPFLHVLENVFTDRGHVETMPPGRV